MNKKIHTPVDTPGAPARIENQTFDQERAFYGRRHLLVWQCLFDGPADGESAFKECEDITAENCIFHLRYPFWHVHGLNIAKSQMSERCRAALWYSDHIQIRDTRLYGIKALRECRDAFLEDCEIVSPEFGWFSRKVTLRNCKVKSEYFLMRGENLILEEVDFQGKYSFQYVKNGVLSHCTLDTKDAFWHSENITVMDSVIKGEYLAWYSNNLMLIRCKIIGTQPLCYCRNLTLIDCEMIDTDLAFEKSDVSARLLSPILSVKNPHSGTISTPFAGEIIMDDPQAAGTVVEWRSDSAGTDTL